MNFSIKILSISAVALFLLSISPLANAQIGPEQVISEPVFASPYLIGLGDLDNNGFDDVIAVGNGSYMVWWQNTGAGSFTGIDTISSDTLLICSSMHTADLDGDSDIDILVTYNRDYWCNWAGDDPIEIDEIEPNRAPIPPAPPPSYEGYLAWFENLGNGEFGIIQVLEDSLTFASSVYSADLDGDTDNDILLGTIFNNCEDSVGIASWIENFGGGVFGPIQLVAPKSDSLSVHVIRAADVDGDEDMDVIANYNKNRNVVWFENDGAGNFGSQIVLDSSLVYNFPLMEIGDMDQDNDIDLLMGGYAEIKWIENNAGSYNSASFSVVSDLNNLKGINVGDLNGDGSLDVMSATLYTDEFGVYENFGNGVFGLEIVIDSTSNGARQIFAIDANNNDQLEVLGFAEYDDDISWYTNYGGLTFGNETRITPEVYYPQGVLAADMDLDSNNDVIVASSSNDEVIMYENLGSATFSNAVIIADSMYNVKGIVSGDLDEDNNVDLVCWSYSSDWIAIIENQGLGVYSQPEFVTNTANGVSAVVLEDMDGDNDLDIVSSYYVADKVVWFENVGNGSFGPEQLLTDSLNSVYDIDVSDIDGDNDLDIVAATVYAPNIVVWFENLGNGVFSPQAVIEDSIYSLHQIQAIDLDFDNDNDLIVETSNGIAWLENIGGANFLPPIVLDSTQINGFHLEDITGNGSQDVLVHNYPIPSALLLENDGMLAFDSIQPFSYSAFTIDIYTSDLDSDEDPDILTTSGEQKVSWFENLYLLTGDEGIESDEPFVNVYPNPTTGRTVIQNSQKMQLTVTDATGRLILTKTCNSFAQIDLSDQPDGVYFLNFESATGTINRKVVKMK